MDYPTAGPTIDLMTKDVRPRARGRASAIPRVGGVDAIQLELGGWSGFIPGRGSTPPRDDYGSSVSALWLPRSQVGPFHGARQGRMAARALTMVAGLGVPIVVVDRPLTFESARRLNRQSATTTFFSIIRSGVPSTSRIAVAVRPRHLVGGREHLDEMLRLRRFAEEWDLDIALDVSAPCDWSWEAEAAVWRLMPRLRIVRLGSLHGPSRHRTEPRLAARVLACLADLDFAGRVAITPLVSKMSWSRQERLMEETRSVAGMVRARLEVQEQPNRAAPDHHRYFSR